MDASDEHKERRHHPEVVALAKLVEDRHDEITKLVKVSIKQNGIIMATQRQAQKEATQHARDDSRLFEKIAEKNGEQDTAIAKLQTDTWYLKKMILAVFGLGVWNTLAALFKWN